MKKILSLILVLALSLSLVVLFSACGAESSSRNSEDSNTETSPTDYAWDVQIDAEVVDKYYIGVDPLSVRFTIRNGRLGETADFRYEIKHSDGSMIRTDTKRGCTSGDVIVALYEYDLREYGYEHGTVSIYAYINGELVELEWIHV